MRLSTVSSHIARAKKVLIFPTRFDVFLRLSHVPSGKANSPPLNRKSPSNILLSLQKVLSTSLAFFFSVENI